MLYKGNLHFPLLWLTVGKDGFALALLFTMVIVKFKRL